MPADPTCPHCRRSADAAVQCADERVSAASERLRGHVDRATSNGACAVMVPTDDLAALLADHDDLGRALAAERAAREAAEREVARLRERRDGLLDIIVRFYDRAETAEAVAADAMREGLAACEGLRDAMHLGEMANDELRGALAHAEQERDTAHSDADRERRARETTRALLESSASEAARRALKARERALTATAAQHAVSMAEAKAYDRAEEALRAALDALLPGGEVGG